MIMGISEVNCNDLTVTELWKHGFQKGNQSGGRTIQVRELLQCTQILNDLAAAKNMDIFPLYTHYTTIIMI